MEKKPKRFHPVFQPSFPQFDLVTHPKRYRTDQTYHYIYIYIYKGFTKSLSFLGLLQPSTPAAGTWVDIRALLIHRIKDTFFVPIKCHMFAVFAYSCLTYTLYSYATCINTRMSIFIYTDIYMYIQYIHSLYIYICIHSIYIYIWLCYMSTISKTIFIWFISYSSPTYVHLGLQAQRQANRAAAEVEGQRAAGQLASRAKGVVSWWIH